MGKKGKKGSGKKKKGGRKKKNEEPQMTWEEAVLAYKIGIKEGQIEEVRFEVRSLEDKHKRHLDRNERLQYEQRFYMENLLKQAKDFEQFLDEEEPVEKQQVVNVMQDKWQAMQDKDTEVSELKELIARTEAEIIRQQREVEYWTHYKEKGQHEHAKQLQLLKLELVDMEESFQEMKSYFEKSLTKDKDEINEKTNEQLELRKFLASEKAMAKMDKNSRQEVIDNDWLKRETEIHRRESDELLTNVEAMERENLLMMSELFECTVQDLKISRSAFMTQFTGEEDLDDTGILEMDLMKISSNEKERSLALLRDETRTRPKSATAKYIENKVFSLQRSPQHRLHDDEEEDSGTSDYDGENEAEGSEDGDPFHKFYHFDDEEFDDYLKLGPLELKLLSVKGTTLPLHRMQTPTEEEIQATYFKPPQWPVTKPMIEKAVRPKKEEGADVGS